MQSPTFCVTNLPDSLDDIQYILCISSAESITDKVLDKLGSPRYMYNNNNVYNDRQHKQCECWGGAMLASPARANVRATV